MRTRRSLMIATVLRIAAEHQRVPQLGQGAAVVDAARVS